MTEVVVMAKPAAFPYKRILVHLATSSARRPAFERALAFARGSRVSLRLVDVLAPLPGHVPNGADLARLLRSEMLDRLAEAVAIARRLHAPTTMELFEGDVATSLVRASVAWRADVLMRSHGIDMKALGPIGPTDGQLVRRCPCPVWFVTARQAEGERVIVAAVDPDPADVPRHKLSVRVAQTAMSVAAARGATVHLVHAWMAYGYPVLASTGTKKGLPAYIDACRDDARARFDALVRDAAVPASVKTHLIEGPGDQVLTAFVEQRRASLLVLGTVGRTGLAGVIVGNTAERVLRHVRCSVLALKPPGFAAAMVERTTRRS